MADEQWVQKGPEFPLVEPQGSFNQLLLKQVRGHGDKIVLVNGETGEEVRGWQLLRRSVAVTMELQRRGVEAGDIVSGALDNCLEAFYVVLGTCFAGAVYAPFNPDLGHEDMKHVVDLLEPKVVICAPRSAEKIRGALGSRGQVVALGDPEWKDFLRLAPGASADSLTVPHARPEDTFCILCSSGTTGPPKGVMLPHRLWHYYVQVMRRSDGALKRMEQNPEVMLQVAANYWTSGFVCNMANAVAGVKTIVYTKFDVDAILAGIEKYRITMVILAPLNFAAIVKHPNVEKYDLSSVREFGSSGAAISPTIRKLAEEKLKKSIVQYYGQTECRQGIFPNRLKPAKPQSVGMAAPNVQAKVVDVETGKTLGPNTEGEIWIKSKLIFTGYYKNPEATSSMLDKDGWIHTGDVGYFDEEGYFYICDRYKELIKYKGTHIAPTEVESVLFTHPGVKDAAVVGIEHDEDQEHPVGFVVRQEGHHVTAQELIALVREKLPVYKQLHGGVYFIEEIPRTGSEKIQRRVLRQKARALQNSSSEANT